MQAVEEPGGLVAEWAGQRGPVAAVEAAVAGSAAPWVEVMESQYFGVSTEVPTTVPSSSTPPFSSGLPTSPLMARTFVTSVHQSKPDSPSLRTTVPVGVATVLNVQRGDALVWTVEPELRRVTVAKRTGAYRP
jgi:hypothetical protein